MELGPGEGILLNSVNIGFRHGPRSGENIPPPAARPGQWSARGVLFGPARPHAEVPALGRFRAARRGWAGLGRLPGQATAASYLTGGRSIDVAGGMGKVNLIGPAHVPSAWLLLPRQRVRGGPAHFRKGWAPSTALSHFQSRMAGAWPWYDADGPQVRKSRAGAGRKSPEYARLAQAPAQ